MSKVQLSVIQQNDNKYNLWVGKQFEDKIEYFSQGMVKEGAVTSAILNTSDSDTNQNFVGFGAGG